MKRLQFKIKEFFTTVLFAPDLLAFTGCDGDVVSGLVFSSNLSAGVVGTIGREYITVSSDFTISDSGNDDPRSITATNGGVHLKNDVLLPESELMSVN
ncbi:MAG: hypothetical protein ACFB0B_06420 [Thermonemataceae bacterium]